MSVGIPRARRTAALVAGVAWVFVLVLLVLPSLAVGATGGRAAELRASLTPLSSAYAPAGGPLVDWLTFHGGENRSGFSPTAGPSNGGIPWVFCGRDPVTHSELPFRTSPVVNLTRVYISNDLGTVFAIDRSNPVAPVWVRALGTTTTTADLVGSLLLVGGTDGNLVALNASSGANVWTSAVGTGVVQGVSVGSGTAYVGTLGGDVVALSLVDGSVQWRARLGAGIGGALALEGSTIYAVTSNGSVAAISTSGSILWWTAVGHPVATAPAVAYGTVVVADVSANVSAYDAANGTRMWRFDGGAVQPNDTIRSTPAVTADRVVVPTEYGQVFAIGRTNGTLLWSRSTGYSGYVELSSPIATTDQVYVVSAIEEVTDFALATGARQWSVPVNLSYGSPALDRGMLFVPDDDGCLYGFASGTGIQTFPISGHVVDRSGAPIAGALVQAGGIYFQQTGPTGNFSFGVPEGAYSVVAEANGYRAQNLSVVVQGPVANLRFVLPPLPVYLVTGWVVDAVSHDGVSGATVHLFGVDLYETTVTSERDGAFSLMAPNGTNFLTVYPPGSYSPQSLYLRVSGAPLTGVLLGVAPTLPSPWGDLPPWGLWAVPFAALSLGAVTVGAWHARRARIAIGLPPTLLSPFARYIAMRLVLIPFQAWVILTGLYIFGSVLPALARQQCASFLVCLTSNGTGYWTFVQNLFFGNWGLVNFGQLQEPATQFLNWWLPDSLELALFALGFSALIAYPLGLAAGWRRNSAFDVGARLGSLVGLLVPSFLVLLFVFGGIYAPFTDRFGDAPFGVIPSTVWFANHGGYPAWIGPASNTFPTGFPLVDGVVHRAWTFEVLVLTKTVIQALVIAVIYVAIFLRFARHAVAEAVSERHVVAARARGVPERTILWRHTSRRVLPIYLLVFGLTLPAYIGTQALVEALSNDQGLGTLLLAEMTHFANNQFGFGATSAAQKPGNFYQVTVFIVVLLVLVGNLCTDVLARYLDPRLVRKERS